MNELTGATATGNSNKAISKASSRANNQASSKVSKVNKVSKGKKAKKDNRDSKVRKDSKDKDHKADNRAVNSRAASNPAARRMVAVNQRATDSAWDQIRAPSWVAARAGATRANFRLRYASGFVKLRTCGASGARPATARGSSMK